MIATLDTLLLKVASRCNIDCSYCYVYHLADNNWRRLPKRMPRDIIRAAAASLEQIHCDQQHPVSVVLHGGEPLLLGQRELNFALHTLRASIPQTSPIYIQTNGILLNDAFLDLFASTSTTISISLDGPGSIHDKNRRDFAGKGTYDRVLRAIDKLRHHPTGNEIFSGVLSVIDPVSDPGNVYEHLKSIGVPGADFLYRDGHHDVLPQGKHSHCSTEYGQWLSTLFDIYIRDKSPIPIRILDDVIRLCLGGYGVKEGVGATEYGILVIDTDGVISKNDTLKGTYGGADRFDQNWNIKETPLRAVLQSQEFARYHQLQVSTHSTCKVCQNFHICGGGMPAHRWSSERHYDNPTIFCADQMLLINHVRNTLRVYFENQNWRKTA